MNDLIVLTDKDGDDIAFPANNLVSIERDEAMGLTYVYVYGRESAYELCMPFNDVLIAIMSNTFDTEQCEVDFE